MDPPFGVTKRYVKVGLLISLFVPSIAGAKLGNTRQQSLEEYGPPFKIERDEVMWESGGDLIDERYGSDETAAVTTYMRMTGKDFTQEERDALLNENLPKIKPGDLVQVKDSPLLRIWTNRAETCSVYTGVHLVVEEHLVMDRYFRTYATKEGNEILNSLARTKEPSDWWADMVQQLADFAKSWGHTHR